MHPHELRVGNLVELNGGVHTVTAQNIPNAHLFKPIKLTEKRAERFGFKQTHSNRWSLKNFHTFELLKVSGGAETFQAVRFYDGSKYYVVKMHVRFVHELQNLYYWLQDTELKTE